MSSLILYLITVFLFILSYIKDKDKTKQAFFKGCRSLSNMMPQFLGIIFIVGITLAMLKPETISSILGGSSGAFGIVLSAVLGSIAMMPTLWHFLLEICCLKRSRHCSGGCSYINTDTYRCITIPMEANYRKKGNSI